MNYTIWKYELKAEKQNIISMPEAAEILSVHIQHGNPYIWALVNKDMPLVDRIIEIYGTGHKVLVDENTNLDFIGTLLLDNGNLIFHVFERIK